MASICEKRHCMINYGIIKPLMTKDFIDEFLVPENVGIDTNIVLLGSLELKLGGKI